MFGHNLVKHISQECQGITPDWRKSRRYNPGGWKKRGEAEKWTQNRVNTSLGRKGNQGCAQLCYFPLPSGMPSLILQLHNCAHLSWTQRPIDFLHVHTCCMLTYLFNPLASAQANLKLEGKRLNSADHTALVHMLWQCERNKEHSACVTHTPELGRSQENNMKPF